MVSRRPFVLRLAGHSLLLVALLFAFAWFLAQPGHLATKSLCGLLALAAGWALWRAVIRSNAEIDRFVSAIRHEDLTQVFRERGQGSGFDALGETLNIAIRRLRDHRAARPPRTGSLPLWSTRRRRRSSRSTRTGGSSCRTRPRVACSGRRGARGSPISRSTARASSPR